MAFTLSARTQAATQQIRQQPQLILEIEGVDTIFANQPILEFLTWDNDFYKWDQDGLFWDGSVEKQDAETLISLSGTTNNFTQQLNVDRAGGTGSVGTIKIAIVDKASLVSKLFSFDNITEIIGKKASVYLSYADTIFPDDSIPLVRGFIDDYSSASGLVQVSVTHPENIKRRTTFKRFTSQLSGFINDTTTTIPVITTQGFIESADIQTSYIQIDDEIMEVVSVDSNTQFTVIRERLNTIAATHDNEAEITSIYQLEGDPVDIGLRLQLSENGNEFFTSDYIINSFNSEDNTIQFENYNIAFSTGLVQGDLIQISGSSFNNGNFTVSFTGVNDDGSSFIGVNENLVNETGDGSTFLYKSQYNTLNIGLGMLPDQVDVQSFLDVQSFYGAAFIPYNYFITDTIKDTKTFLDTEIYFPQGIYSIPRKAAAAIKYTAPPLSTENIPVLNSNNIVNISDLRPLRSTAKYYYNEVIYNFNYNIPQDKLLDTFVSISNESKSRIKTGDKTLEINARGIERSSQAIQTLTTTSNRLLNRYRFAAVLYKNVQLLYKNFNLEVGDTVLFGNEDTKQVDYQTGERSGLLKSYEIINKRLNTKTGRVSLDILETGFGIDGRFAVFSPSSNVLSGSTTTSINVGNIFPCEDEPIERNKYVELIGAKLRVRSEDYNYDEETTLVSLSPTNPNAIIVEALPSAPLHGYIVELAEYNSQLINEAGELVKIKYSFTTPQANITSVVDAQTFDIDDTTNFANGMLIQAHSDNFDRDSDEVTIDTIVGNTITLTQALNITPQIGDKLESLGFSDSLDGGYRFV